MSVGLVPGSTPTQFGIAGTNYCGPGYANGKFGGNADPNGEAKGPIDEACQRHDVAYGIAALPTG